MSDTPLPQRRLKVRLAFRRRKYKSIFVPELHLSGKWLAQAGFLQGNQVLIEVAEDQLIISKIPLSE